ncbi:sulfurtransferase complex subunit TusB [Oceanicoccus sp. KOV_DT_Chl]|uniref:sulfurtransferase complex subunit TusB n=1 Tax=Oceanicoccus sp. KOV_DT_Chl TaxID=1904639 RepID=UPI000C7B1957|nr:sulfurtransferase complex subunit TusB [Oceanicoccus sp. KOV_DT_Chl]
MILHTVNKSPFNHSSFEECLRVCSAGSSILLIEDGVYAAKNHTKYAALIEQHSDIRFYALVADIKARGLSDQLSDTVTVIDDVEFVTLSTQHKSVQSWY